MAENDGSSGDDLSGKEEAVSCQWEYEISRGKWVSYGKTLNDLLNGTDTNPVKTTVDEANLVLDTVTMRQRNEDSGFERGIRCAVAVNDGLHFAWEYLDGRRRRSFPKASAIRLELAHNKGHTTVDDIILDGVQFRVDLTEMTMTAGAAHRAVYRGVSDAASAIAASPAPAVARTRALARREAAKKKDNAPAPAPPVEDHLEEESRGSSRKRARTQSSQEIPGILGRLRWKAALAEKSARRRIVVKGRASVDVECTAKVALAHVFYQGDDVYDVMLNQTNIQFNNNKFFIIQLLQDDAAPVYSVWFRWGRVGFKGQCNLIDCAGDLDKAKQIFCAKFLDKTHNEWGDRARFTKVPGKYDLIEMDYSAGHAGNVENVNPEDDNHAVADCQLEQAVQRLIKLICDVRTMEETVVEMEYDMTKAPLGRLTKAQVIAGYEALKSIETAINERSFSRAFVDAVNEYYTRIPHSFGMRQPPLIKSKEDLKKELDLLDVLLEIEVAMRVLNAPDKGEGHVLDRRYRALHCRITPVASESAEFAMVERYLQSTHASTHNTYRMHLKTLYEVERDGETAAFAAHLGNRHLLWHGSRLSNFFGILSRGLQIAPPEAPSTGYMFGKGIYFADISSKSANYCFPQRGRPSILVLADVALGNWRDLTAADCHADRLPADRHSTRGLGRIGPDPQTHTTLANGCVVPCGTPIALENREDCTLNYNEYVVYNRNQVLIRYLLEVEFTFC